MRGAWLLLCLPAAAHACPSAGDLADGIRFIDVQGEIETHTQLTPHTVQVDFLGAGETAPSSRSVLVYGAYILWHGDLVDGRVNMLQRSTYAYARPASELPAPSPGLTWSENITYVSEGDILPETYSVVVSHTPYTFSIGACSYEAYGMRTVNEEDTGDFYGETIHWLPALGTGVLASYFFNDDVTSLAYARIEAVNAR